MITGSPAILHEIRARAFDERAVEEVRYARAAAREWARCRRLALATDDRPGSLTAAALATAWHDQIGHHLEVARTARRLAQVARDQVDRCLAGAA